MLRLVWGCYGWRLFGCLCEFVRLFCCLVLDCCLVVAVDLVVCSCGCGFKVGCA